MSPYKIVVTRRPRPKMMVMHCCICGSEATEVAEREPYDFDEFMICNACSRLPCAQVSAVRIGMDAKPMTTTIFACLVIERVIPLLEGGTRVNTH